MSSEIAGHTPCITNTSSHPLFRPVCCLRGRATVSPPWLLPRGVIPGWLLRLLGPLFGLSRKYQDNHVGIRFTVDNRRGIEELGLRYRPLRETLADHYRSWQAARDAAA